MRDCGSVSGKIIAAVFYSVADNVGDYSKAGIINTRNKSTTASDGVDLLFNTNAIGTITSSLSYSNLGFNDTSVTPNIFKEPV